MDTFAYALLFVGALAGGFVTCLAGFGTALMALGIWIYVLEPSLAVPLVLICSVVAQTSTLPSMWRSFDLGIVWPFLIGGLAGVPLGTILIAHADPNTFKLSVGILLLIFPTALYLRRKKEAHKRLMLLAFTAILAAAVARFPGVLPLGPLWFFGLTFLPILASCITYDVLTRRRVHPAYLWGGALLILSVPLRLMISSTPTWHRLAQMFVGK